MAFRLDRSEQQRKVAIVELLKSKANALDEVVVAANNAIENAVANVNTAIEAYNSALEDAQSFVDEVRDRLQTEHDDKSERWQESERASAAQAYISSFELSLDALDVVEVDAIDLTFDHAEQVEGLPEEVES